MNRAEALAYLQTEFSQQTADTGMSILDTQEGFKPAIDQALREVGTPKADLATADVVEADEPALEAFLEYYALQRFAKLLAQNIDITDSGTTARLQQSFANITKLLDLATVRAKSYGLGSYTSSAYSFQTLVLDC